MYVWENIMYKMFLWELRAEKDVKMILSFIEATLESWYRFLGSNINKDFVV